MKSYYSTSFASMSIGWIGLILTHIIWSILNYNDAAGGDIGLIIFWSGVFSLLFYLLFVIFPQKFIKRQLETRNLFEFSMGMALYSLVGFTTLIGWLFLQSSFHIVILIFFLDAFVAGLIFGISFWWSWNAKEQQFTSFWKKAGGYLIPVLFLGIYLKALPVLSPSFAYNVVPESIQNEITVQVLSTIKVGDSVEEIKHKLPGFITNDNCQGSKAGQYEKSEFRLQWNCCKVVDIEVGARGEINQTIGGEILNKPCE